MEVVVQEKKWETPQYFGQGVATKSPAQRVDPWPAKGNYWKRDQLSALTVFEELREC